MTTRLHFFNKFVTTKTLIDELPELSSTWQLAKINQYNNPKPPYYYLPQLHHKPSFQSQKTP